MAVAEEAPKSQRRCSKCDQVGHNARRCISEGHKLLKESKKKVTTEINGQRPKKGLWIVSQARKKVAGKIMYVKRSGQVVWQDPIGTFVTSTPDIFERADYEYCELEPQMLRWDRTIGL